MSLACWMVAGAAEAAAEWRAWPGGATPPLALRDLTGKTRTLADFRGRVVIVNFWATWCEPCIEEMPSLDRLRARHAGQGLETLGVNLGESDRRVEDWVAKLGVHLPILLDRDETAKRDWKVRGVPASFLLGRDGKIRWLLVGQVDFADPRIEARVLALLREPVPAASRRVRHAPDR